MEHFEKPPRQEQPPQPQPEHAPEHTKEGPEAIVGKLEALLKENESEENSFVDRESGFFATDPGERSERTKKIEHLSRELAIQEPEFKEALVEALTTTLDNMELGEKSWTIEMIAQAFRAYSGKADSLF